MEVPTKIVVLIGIVIASLLTAVGALSYMLYYRPACASGGSGGDGEYDASVESASPFSVNNEAMLLGSEDEIDAKIEKATERKPIFILFGHKDCPHCSSCVGTFEEAAADLAGRRAFVVEASRVGSDAIENYNIDAFPSVVKYTSPTERVEYEGNRSKKSFVKFLARRCHFLDLTRSKSERGVLHSKTRAKFFDTFKSLLILSLTMFCSVSVNALVRFLALGKGMFL